MFRVERGCRYFGTSNDFFARGMFLSEDRLIFISLYIVCCIPDDDFLESFLYMCWGRIGGKGVEWLLGRNVVFRQEYQSKGLLNSVTGRYLSCNILFNSRQRYSESLKKYRCLHVCCFSFFCITLPFIFLKNLYKWKLFI